MKHKFLFALALTSVLSFGAVSLASCGNEEIQDTTRYKVNYTANDAIYKVEGLKSDGYLEGEKVELQGSDCNGYIVHSIKYKGIKKQVKAHQVIWMSVNGEYDKTKYQIDHINRDRKDNRIDNLRLVTPKGNVANSKRWKGKFSDWDKDNMYILHYDNHMTLNEIAELYECSPARIGQIIYNHQFHRLSGITFPKWRTESIKALGNSMVPQILYEIFLAIEQTNEQNTTENR